MLWVAAIIVNIQAQTQLKLMSYNLLHYPTGTNIDRKDDLRYILNHYQPDIFMACEVEDATGADEILNYCLGTQDYAGAYFTYNHSGSQYPLQQMLYYNRHKFELVNETYLVTYVRDINHYTLKLLTQDVSDDIYLDIYVGHLKASQSDTIARRDMVQVLVNDLQNIPTGHFVVFAGDFNLYNASEPAYQLMTNQSNAVVFKDPVNREGSWHNNYNFRDIDTQATHSVSENDYVGGGIDDRFDFIMLSENLMNSPVLHYVTGTYAAYGNNGNCFNKAITSSYCNGSTYDYTLRSHLYNMSDHLPVVLSLETPASLDTPIVEKNLFKINEGTMINDYLSISSGEMYETFEISIYNTTGQLIKQILNYKTNEPVNFSNFTTGVYFLQIDTGQKHQVIKFVKTD